MEPGLLFGLGEQNTIEELEIIWPDGNSQSLTNVSANQTLILDQANAVAPTKRSANSSKPLLSENEVFAQTALHQENTFNDFDHERLLPHMLSTEGPRLLKADVNGDLLEDVLVLGSKGQADQLYLQTGSGQLEKSAQAGFQADSSFESTCGVFFDRDGDGDQDLLLGAGGNEIGRGIEAFLLRYYENDGEANFIQIAEQTPPAGGQVSVILAEDFDGDGDADLWLVGEWMPITLLENKNQRFYHKEVPAFEPTNGWWNRLAHADFDGDGDQDFIVGNLGLNSSVQASLEEPCTLYLADFDQNGVLDPIICSFNEGLSYPMASKDEITQQIIALRRPYERYADYAQSTIVDLFGQAAVDDALQRKATFFRTTYIENLGDGQFRLVELPQEVQYAPIYAIQTMDVNQDGKMDAVLGGNFSGVGPGRGRYDASFGWYLAGNGDGSFDLQQPSESGLWLEGESRRFALLNRKPATPLLLVGRNNGPIGLWSTD